MILKELKNWINRLPSEFDEYSVVNGEVGYIELEGKEDGYYRVDKPIITLTVDEDSKEICFFHQTQDDVKTLMSKE